MEHEVWATNRVNTALQGAEKWGHRGQENAICFVFLIKSHSKT